MLGGGRKFALGGPFDVFWGCHLASGIQVGTSRERAWSLIHPFPPFLEPPLECVVDDGINLLRVSFKKVEIEYVDGILGLVFSFASRGRVVDVLVHELLDVFDILECLFEIVLTALTFLVTLLDKFEGSETEATFAIRFTKETDGLAFDPESANGFFVGQVIRGFRVWGCGFGG